MAIYTIMIKNRALGKIEVIKDTINRVKLSDWFYSVYSSPEKFIINRVNVSKRANILDMCKYNEMYTLEDYINITKCISVTDAIWLKSNANDTWEKVNAYTNRISSILADSAINGIKYLHGNPIKSPSPQYNISGSIDKCVKRISGKTGIYLYKSLGTIEVETSFVRPYSEYFAYRVANQIGINRIVKYDIKEHIAENGYTKPYCICKLFTNNDISLIDYEDSIYRDRSLLEVSNIFLRNNMKEDARTVLNMLILDSIILNCDRHASNYGFLLDNNTGKYIGFAPIYDNDCSLGALDAVRGYNLEEVYSNVVLRQPKTELGNYNEQALAAMHKNMFNRLKSIGQIKLQRGNAQAISDERLDFINYVINRRIKEIVDLVKETYHLSD